MTASTIEPYLFFGGRCEEAMNAYAAVFSSSVEMLMRFRDNPQPPKPGSIPPGFEDKVMHAQMRVGTTTLMASDGDRAECAFAGFRLSFTAGDPAQAKRVFDALAVGGSIQMPLAKTFWSPLFGMVTDRFGVGWMVTLAPA